MGDVGHDIKAEIARIVELYRQSELAKWEAARLALDVYRRSRGRERELVIGLADALAVSDDTVYNLIHAAALEHELGIDGSSLHVSHFAMMWRARRCYRLTNEQVLEYLNFAAEEGLSVRALASLVANTQEEDVFYAFSRTIRKLVSLCAQVLSLVDYIGLENADDIRREFSEWMKRLSSLIEDKDREQEEQIEAQV